MSLRFTFILFTTIVALAEARPGLVRRMRRVPDAPADCALAIAWEEDDPSLADTHWEQIIGLQNEAVDAIVANARQLATPAYTKLAKARESLTPGSNLELAEIAPYANYLDNPTYDRWRHLKDELGVKLATVDLGTSARVGANAEFSMAYFDSETMHLRVNLQHDFEHWVHSLRADNVEDLDVILVGKLAGAFFHTRTTDSPDFVMLNEDFLRFYENLERLHPEIAEIFAAEEEQANDLPWRYDSVGQTWIYFRDRLEIQESLRAFQKFERHSVPVHSFFYRFLSRHPPDIQRRVISRLIIQQHSVEPRLVKILENIDCPNDWKN